MTKKNKQTNKDMLLARLLMVFVSGVRRYTLKPVRIIV